MTAAAVTGRRKLSRRPLSARDLGRTRADRRGDSSGGGRLTLEQLLDGVWEGLHADGAAECPACGGRMSRVEAGGACSGCGTMLV